MMTQQQKLLWEKLTEKVMLAGMDNLYARELYDEICKLINMEKKEKSVIISISDTGDGLEVKVNEIAYGNLAIVGLLEKIKIGLITESSAEQEHSSKTAPISNAGNYDA